MATAQGTARETEGRAVAETAGTTSAPWPRRLARRLSAAITGAIGALAGLAPHLLHHAAPIAGAAVLAGAAGAALFGAAGLALSVPFLLRLRRRFGTWKAPIVALVLFAAAFSLSNLVIGPALRGEDSSTTPAIEHTGTPAGDREDHHP